MKVTIKPMTKLSERQIEILKNALDPKIKFVGVCTGRQVGKTEIAIHLLTHWLINEKHSQTIGVAFPTNGQCEEMLNRFAARFKGLMFLQFNKSSHTIYNTLNGNRVKFVSALSKDGIRGISSKNMIIDEACFINDEIYHRDISPLFDIGASNDNGGKLIVLSTPKYKNWFYDIIHEPPYRKEECYIARFTSEEGGLISKERLEYKKKFMPYEIFANEHLGEFLEEGTGLFKYKGCLIDENVLNAQRNKVISAKEGVFAGVDWGVEDDYTVLSIIDKDGYLIEVHKWKQIEWNTIIDNIVKVVSKYRCTVYAETNGIGNMPFKELRNRYSNTQAFTTTNKSKNDIIQKLIMDFEKGEIKIPNRNDLLVELDSFELNVTKFGNITYGARQGFHDDMLMSLAIANHKRVKSTFAIGGK